jgi:hypothetical protein
MGLHLIEIKVEKLLSPFQSTSRKGEHHHLRHGIIGSKEYVSKQGV